MDNDRRVDAKHVCIRPYEDILVFSEETDQLIPEASRQLRSDPDRALWVLVIQLNGFQLLDRSTFLLLFPSPRIKFS